jgi:hypothetical protein
MIHAGHEVFGHFSQLLHQKIQTAIGKALEKWRGRFDHPIQRPAKKAEIVTGQRHASIKSRVPESRHIHSQAAQMVAACRSIPAPVRSPAWPGVSMKPTSRSTAATPAGVAE